MTRALELGAWVFFTVYAPILSAPRQDSFQCYLCADNDWCSKPLSKMGYDYVPSSDPDYRPACFTDFKQNPARTVKGAILMKVGKPEPFCELANDIEVCYCFKPRCNGVVNCSLRKSRNATGCSR